MSRQAPSTISALSGRHAFAVLSTLPILLLLSVPDLLAGQATNLRLPSLPWGTPEDVVTERLEARGFHFAGEPEDGTLLFDRADLLGREAGIIVRTLRGRLVKLVALMEPESPSDPEREFEALVATLKRFYGAPTRRSARGVALGSRAGPSDPRAARDDRLRVLWLERDELGRPYGARLTIDPERRLRLDLESAAWAEAAAGRELEAGPGYRMLVRSSEAAYRWAGLEFSTRLLGGTRGPLQVRSRVTNVREHRTGSLRIPWCIPWIRIYRDGELVYDRGSDDEPCFGPERIVDLAPRESEPHHWSVPLGKFLPPNRQEATLEVFVFLPRANHPSQPPRAASEIRVGEVVVNRTVRSEAW